MTNFDFLLSTPSFSPFASAAVAAERVFAIDPATCAMNCRRAMEAAVKWMYSVDGELSLPWDDRLVSLLSTEEFRDIVGEDMLRRLDYIRKKGNDVAHSTRPVSPEEAQLCLENLFAFMDFVAYCYADHYEPRAYDPALAEQAAALAPVAPVVPEVDLEALMRENERLRAELTARREAQQPAYTPQPLALSEYETRKLYINAMLVDAGWIEGRNWINEYPVKGMPSPSGEGRADYVLLGDDGRPLAVIEAKASCKDVAVGRQQAKLYADALERQFGRRPVIFLTNGFETRIWNDRFEPERRVAAVWAKRDLEKLFNLQAARTSLKTVSVNRAIAGRYYQEAAIRAVCDTFDEKNRRKALLVMATGSGKTRTVIALVDVLLQHGWIKNVLFLADRTSLVTQAKRAFVNLLPDLSVTNLCEERDNYGAHCVFSTYQTMFGLIDSAADGEGRLFTCGHFDLVICDEAHRSIYNKYRDIFDYFDARLVGLTATPKDEIDRNTYDVFGLGVNTPTYAYDLAQAVRDGYLVDFKSIETQLKFLTEGIVYDELPEDEREEYESTFTDEDGNLPEAINPSALNEWVFNEDTIREVLNVLMTQGLRVRYGEQLGKTIIFAKNHAHAEKILEIFYKEYPSLVGYAKVIDNYMTYAQSAIDEFSEGDKLPRIAISVDMLDTGIDVPEILNLVFFKKVMSKAKFWQMIGRGTRLCPSLLDGEDKQCFYIFDFCGNFEFFRMHKQGRENASGLTLQGAIFKLKAQLAFKLQDPAFQTTELIDFRKGLVADLLGKVQALNLDNWAVKLHLQPVEQFSVPERYDALTYPDTLVMAEEIAPLVLPDSDDASAVRFDALLYGIELALLEGQKYPRARNDLLRRVKALSSVANIPEIMAQSTLMHKLLHEDYLENANISQLEDIRENLRSLMKYLPRDGEVYHTHFNDDILAMDWHDSDLESDDLGNYRAKAEFYVRQHPDHLVIHKLRTNQPLTETDVQTLEGILWSEIGTQQDYEAAFGRKPLGEFVREIVGLDMNAAKEAFSRYLDDTRLDSRQIYFVNQIVEYIVHNGMMKDLSVLQEPPFTDRGSIVDIFRDVSVWMGIREVIDSINDNAAVG